MSANQNARLRWLCRRGTRELDRVLERYLNQRYPQLSDAQQQCFIRFLHAEDDHLIDCLFGTELPHIPEETEHLVQDMKQYAL